MSFIIRTHSEKLLHLLVPFCVIWSVSIYFMVIWANHLETEIYGWCKQLLIYQLNNVKIILLINFITIHFPLQILSSLLQLTVLKVICSTHFATNYNKLLSSMCRDVHKFKHKIILLLSKHKNWRKSYYL